MQNAYTKRYGRPFSAIQFTLDVPHWSGFAKRNLTPAQPPEFLYVGSIFPDAQLQSLIDCCEAVAALNQDGFACRLRIVSQSRTLARFGARLAVHPNIVLANADLGDDAFYQTLAAADALLLPVNFDRHSVDLMRYSMPTKVPSYLVSGTPCFVYGCDDTAQVRYARDSGWGHVLAERSMPRLKADLVRMIEDSQLRRDITTAARKAAANHDARLVRSAFHDILRHAADSHKMLR